ncbi:MAG: glycosyltransferase family 2 protein [Deltaproteobacteria bacterium]|nr:glycosyltransferase family 2 protein [Deltaproteobacteria bacterium]
MRGRVAPVTVVVPCFNEAEGLPMLLARLAALRRGAAADWQVLFVDDGSSDDTFAQLLRAARDARWVSVLRHHENRGLGAALRTGFAHVQSPIVCTIDSDCTYPPERLPELTELVEQGADIATASAWHPDSAAAAEGSRMRLLLSRQVSGIYRGLLGRDVHTFTCLFRAYNLRVLRRIRFRGDGFSAVAEIFLKAMLAGYRVREVPMALETRRFGESKLRVGDAVLAHAHLITLTTLAVGARQARQVFGR